MTSKFKFRNKHDKGNALFLILIAVALFAALSYAVTQSGRGGSGIDKEQASLAAAQITQYASTIEQNLLRLRIINNCSDTEVSFHYDSDGDGVLETDGSDEYYNPNSSGNTSCYVFDGNGSGLSYEDFPDNFFAPECLTASPTSPSCNRVRISSRAHLPGVGADEPELTLFLLGIDLNICESIQNNVTGSTTIPDSSFWITEYRGTYSGTPAGNTMSTPNGQAVGCFRFPSADYYAYYHAVLPR